MDMLKKQIEFEEGRRLKMYRCTAGHNTIGVGHNCDAMPYFKAGAIPPVIDDAYCDELLEFDIQRTIDDLDEHWHGFQLLAGARRDAIINMAFQIGVAGLMKFKKMLDYLNKCDWQRAADEALKSNWAKQTPVRAKRVAGQIRTNVYYVVPD